MHMNKGYDWSHWEHGPDRGAPPQGGTPPYGGGARQPSYLSGGHHHQASATSPGYNYNSGNDMATDHNMVEIQTKDIERTQWSWCSTGCAVFTFLLCCPWFGFIGLVYSLLAYTDHKSRDYGRSRNKRSCAWGWTIAGFIIGLLLWAGVITVIVLVSSAVITWSSVWTTYWTG